MILKLQKYPLEEYNCMGRKINMKAFYTAKLNISSLSSYKKDV